MTNCAAYQSYRLRTSEKSDLASRQSGEITSRHIRKDIRIHYLHKSRVVGISSRRCIGQCDIEFSIRVIAMLGVMNFNFRCLYLSL